MYGSEAAPSERAERSGDVPALRGFQRSDGRVGTPGARRSSVGKLPYPRYWRIEAAPGSRRRTMPAGTPRRPPGAAQSLIRPYAWR